MPFFGKTEECAFRYLPSWRAKKEKERGGEGGEVVFLRVKIVHY